MDWFRTRPLSHGVWLVAEPALVNLWLIAGTERAVLLDTGCGISPIQPVISTLTDLPVTVINTHYHSDHIGGNAEFDEVVTHESGAELVATPLAEEWRAGFASYLRDLLACAEAYRAIDRKHFHLLESFNDIGPLPPGFDLDSWNIVTGPPTATVVDGDRIELGDRTLIVMHTPGHTPDSICLYDEREGLLFTGDTVLTGANLAQFNEADLAAYAASTRRLADMAGDVSLVVPHHYGRTTIDPAFLTEVADGMEEVAAGEATLVPSIDLFSNRVLAATYDRFSILVADPDLEPLPTFTDAEGATPKGSW